MQEKVSIWLYLKSRQKSSQESGYMSTLSLLQEHHTLMIIITVKWCPNEYSLYCIDFLLLRYNAVLSNTVGRRYSWTRPFAGKFIQTNYQIWMNFSEIGLAQKLFDIFCLWILSFGWAFQIFLSIFVDRKVSKKEALLLKLECGVNIRLIVDSEYMFVTGSKVPILAQAGVKVIHDHTTGLFHHKFAIIDHKILITGSLNWTRQEW